MVDYSERCRICGTLAAVGCDCWVWVGREARYPEKAGESGEQPSKEGLSNK